MRRLLVVVALAAVCSCSARMQPASFKEQVQDLASIAEEGRLLLGLHRSGKVPRTFFRAHAEALADRAAEHLAELTRRETDDALLSKQAEAIDQARALADVLRPLAERIDPSAFDELRRLAQTFEGMEHVL
jgi:hypothetical protein